jgi:hypothetical protein
MVSMRSDLLRIITRWEQSGQGEGGWEAEEWGGCSLICQGSLKFLLLENINNDCRRIQDYVCD